MRSASWKVKILKLLLIQRTYISKNKRPVTNYWESFCSSFCTFSVSIQVLNVSDRGTTSTAGHSFQATAHGLWKWKSSCSSHAPGLQRHSCPPHYGPLEENEMKNILEAEVKGRERISYHWFAPHKISQLSTEVPGGSAGFWCKPGEVGRGPLAQKIPRFAVLSCGALSSIPTAAQSPVLPSSLLLHAEVPLSHSASIVAAGSEPHNSIVCERHPLQTLCHSVAVMWKLDVIKKIELYENTFYPSYQMHLYKQKM